MTRLGLIKYMLKERFKRRGYYIKGFLKVIYKLNRCFKTKRIYKE